MRLLALFFGAIVANGAVIRKDADEGIPGYETEILATEVEVSPGQFQIFHGTVEEVHAQALKVNPHFKLNAPPTKNIEARVPHNQIFCDRYDYADAQVIQQGVDYLRRVPGQPHNGPGPGKCSRVSCSYNSAIWWCNDYPHDFNLRTFNQIADSAKRITEVCYQYPGAAIKGQNFEQTDWNTIVRGANC